MHLLYYITSHGYGHGVRSCAVINALSPDVDVTVRSALPAEFLGDEIRRPFVHASAELDCGCVQVDSLVVDVRQTVERYSAIARRNRSRLRDEVRWCRECGADVIAADTTPFAFDVAREAGIPSAAVTNFTWYDIYRPFVERFPEFAAVVEEVRGQYASATLCLEMAPANDMPYFPQRERVGVVGRVGRDRSGLLRRRLGIGDSPRIGLIYPGNFGIGDMSWEGLERFGDWHFVGLYPLPGTPQNYRIISKAEFPYQDLVASADLVVSKIGYATVAECMLNGTPLVYLPREGFTEYPALKAGVDEWGFGYCLDAQTYRSLAWDDLLRRVPARGTVPRVPPQGVRRCAEALVELGRRRA